MALIDRVKTACRVTSESYNAELTGLIYAALADIGITDVKAEKIESPDDLDQTCALPICRACRHRHYGC